MRLFATWVLIAIAWTASAQESCPAPLDADQDGLIGINDMLNLLGFFGDTDMDFDGIFDSVDDCVGYYDECGVCNGPGPQILGIDTIIVHYDSLYAEPIDEWIVFEVDADTLLGYFCEYPGCTDPSADNYDPYAIEDDNSCIWEEGSPVCDFQNSFTFDGHTYDLVAIGNQCWFAENLRTRIYANGDSILTELNLGSSWAGTTNGAVSVYGESGNCEEWVPEDDACDPEWSLNEYGRLYNRYAVADERGLCPSGWHVPTGAEWEVLVDYLGGIANAGAEMKATYGWRFNGNGTNSSGFSALPGGMRQGSDFFSAGSDGFWWLGDSNSFRRMLHSTSGVPVDNVGPQWGHSVRCMKNVD